FLTRVNSPDDVAMSNVTGGTVPPAVTPSTPAVSTPSTPSQPPTTPPAASSSSSSPPPPPSTSSTPTPTTPSTSSTPPPATSSPPPPPTSSTPPPATSSRPTPSSTPVTTSSSSTPPAPTTSAPTTVVTETPTTLSTAVTTVVRTSTTLPSSSSPAATTSSTSTPTPNDPAGSGSGGLSQGSKVAIGVVVPIAAIAILAILGLFWWKKRRARQEAEEERRKEVEDYAYNPNADPTIPAVSMAAADNSYEMREDGGSGYRGWGSTTAAGSTGRKASTTMSGGMAGGAYSDMTSPTRVANSEARSGEALLDGSSSPDGEILGAMGPAAANNRGDVRRGPSNASSSYSAGGRSEGSEGGVYGNGGGAYYDQYAQNPYSDQRPQELPGQAVIRDNPARRNTRIENPAHYPQQSAGIAQNF
ncbi:hypothetical protein JDV02_010522, partial [Purpureocillium takamizusanense]